MSRKDPGLLTIFSYLPWWASIIAGSLVYFALKFVFPILVSENQILLMVATAAQSFAWMFGCLFLIPAISSIFKRKKRKQLLNQQKSIETLRETSWRDFEILVGEAFRRRGYAVQENTVGGADGGVDLTLFKDKKQHIVQCKQWRSSKVGVSVVREMFGVMKASNAESVFVVASGYFTNDAIAFARDLPIELVDGERLIELIANVQKSPQAQKSVVEKELTRECPKCAAPLVKRIARRGANIGNEFLGCSSFPKCRHIET